VVGDRILEVGFLPSLTATAHHSNGALHDYVDTSFASNVFIHLLSSGILLDAACCFLSVGFDLKTVHFTEEFQSLLLLAAKCSGLPAVSPHTVAISSFVNIAIAAKLLRCALL
jgi:hypothetical protein